MCVIMKQMLEYDWVVCSHKMIKRGKGHSQPTCLESRTVPTMTSITCAHVSWNISEIPSMLSTSVVISVRTRPSNGESVHDIIVLWWISDIKAALTLTLSLFKAC